MQQRYDLVYCQAWSTYAPLYMQFSIVVIAYQELAYCMVVAANRDKIVTDKSMLQ